LPNEYPGFASHIDQVVSTLTDPDSERDYMTQALKTVASLEDLRQRHRKAWRSIPAFSADRKLAMVVSRNPMLLARLQQESTGGPFPLMLERMPAHRINIAFEEGTIRGDGAVAVTDVEDQRHLISAVYADTFFVDGRTLERLRVGGWASDHARRNSTKESLRDFLRNAVTMEIEA